MDVLIGLVIAIFIITAAYVGFHASQEPIEAGGHGIQMDPTPQIILKSHAENIVFTKTAS